MLDALYLHTLAYSISISMSRSARCCAACALFMAACWPACLFTKADSRAWDLSLAAQSFITETHIAEAMLQHWLRHSCRGCATTYRQSNKWLLSSNINSHLCSTSLADLHRLLEKVSQIVHCKTGLYVRGSTHQCSYVSWSHVMLLVVPESLYWIGQWASTTAILLYLEVKSQDLISQHSPLLCFSILSAYCTQHWFSLCQVSWQSQETYISCLWEASGYSTHNDWAINKSWALDV